MSLMKCGVEACAPRGRSLKKHMRIDSSENCLTHAFASDELITQSTEHLMPLNTYFNVKYCENDLHFNLLHLHNISIARHEKPVAVTR